MGLKLRWFRARMNFASRPRTTTDLSAPSHGLYRPTYSVYEADTLATTSRSTNDLSRQAVAVRLPSKQTFQSMPDLGVAPSTPLNVRPPHSQHNSSSLHNPLGQRDVPAAINPAFTHQTFDAAAQDTARTKNKLQLKINIPAESKIRVSPQPGKGGIDPKSGRNKATKAPAPPKQVGKIKNKKDNGVIDLRFGGESES